MVAAALDLGLLLARGEQKSRLVLIFQLLIWIRKFVEGEEQEEGQGGRSAGFSRLNSQFT